MVFKSIKLRIVKGRKLLTFATVKLLQEHDDDIRALKEAVFNNEDSNNSSSDTQSPTTYNLSFTVNDGTNPVEGAIVTIGEITGTTGSAGGCTLSNVPEGSQTVTVTCDGFTNYSDTINVSEENTSFTISLTAE